METPPSATAEIRNRLSAITLDPKSLGQANAAIEHEREVAIFDILDGNVFAVDGAGQGPFQLHLVAAGDKLMFQIADDQGAALTEHAVQLAPLKRIIKDYFMICESYYEAVRTSPPSKIQSIDVSRRALHDEGSKLLQEKLLPRIATDAATARRLFTLVCALHWKG